MSHFLDQFIWWWTIGCFEVVAVMNCAACISAATWNQKRLRITKEILTDNIRGEGIMTSYLKLYYKSQWKRQEGAGGKWMCVSTNEGNKETVLTRIRCREWKISVLMLETWRIKSTWAWSPLQCPIEVCIKRPNDLWWETRICLRRAQGLVLEGSMQKGWWILESWGMCTISQTFKMKMRTEIPLKKESSKFLQRKTVKTFPKKTDKMELLQGRSSELLLSHSPFIPLQLPCWLKSPGHYQSYRQLIN